MNATIAESPEVQALLHDAAGYKNTQGNPRSKQIVLRLLQETAKLIEELDISDDEFWAGVEYINRLGKNNEAGLLVAGLGVEHFLDLLHDAKQAGGGQQRRLLDGLAEVAPDWLTGSVGQRQGAEMPAILRLGSLQQEAGRISIN